MTLDTGRCPKWLFDRMVKLGRHMCEVIVAEYGPDEFIRRMGDPVWFQTLGTVLAFDWNASGLTTILTAALKESMRDMEQELGIFICGGKGATSRKTPQQIMDWSERIGFSEQHAFNLVHNSKMSAKVDSSLVQDGYQLYHHSFMFSRNGAWVVVQQGMNTESASARRYHWSSDHVTDLVREPHSAIQSQRVHRVVLNMTSSRSDLTRQTSLGLVDAGYNAVMKDINLLRRHSSSTSEATSWKDGQDQFTFAEFAPVEFKSHPVIHEDLAKSKYLDKILRQLTDTKPEDYATLLAQPGVGPKTIRALALVAEVIYGAKPSYEDPARYGFAHGGKDKTPYPVDRSTYDTTIATLRALVAKTKIDASDKKKAIDKLWSLQSH
jgi:hypothetical protein